jgi:hypothetical protein
MESKIVSQIQPLKVLSGIVFGLVAGILYIIFIVLGLFADGIGWYNFILWHAIGGVIHKNVLIATWIGAIIFTAIIGAIVGPLISKCFSKSTLGKNWMAIVLEGIGGAIGGAIIGAFIGYFGGLMMVVTLALS